MAYDKERGYIRDTEKYPDCPTCKLVEQEKGFGPSHEGSRACRSGSIASGGNYPHCACDTCF